MFKEFLVEIKTNWVAIYGAIIASIGLILSLVNYFRDRAKITIKIRRNWKVIGEGGFYKHNTHYHEVKVINKGRRPIKIENAGARICKDKKPWVLFSDSFMQNRNRVLTEENPTTDFMIEAKLLDFDNVYFVTVYDATGKMYKKWIHPLKYYWDYLLRKAK